jgi:uncharacterized repeat protein (TIGR03803 family)
MQPMKTSIGNPFILGALIAGLCLIPAGPAAAQNFTNLHNFSATDPVTFTNYDGAHPESALVVSGSTLYGTAYYGGNSSNGTVFAINTDGTGFVTRHSFSPTALNSSDIATNSDGAFPLAALILSGNTLYGATELGGIAGSGTLFKVNTDGTSFATLYSFTALPVYAPLTNIDGWDPDATLVLSGDTLYGTAFKGGTNGTGTVFSVTTNGTGFAILYTFGAIPDSQPFTNSDGAWPVGGLLLSGNTLYGMAYTGGTSGNGTLFALNTDGTGFTTLHAFTAPSGSPLLTNSDGAGPFCSLALSGNTLYGTASRGGSSGGGTVFAISTNGTSFTTLHSFMALPATAPYTNSDGFGPEAGLILSGRILYGTADVGGRSGDGTVFAVSTNGAAFATLYSFSARDPVTGTNSDGAYLIPGLFLSGNTLYGTAYLGGTSSNGTVFSLSAIYLPFMADRTNGLAPLTVDFSSPEVDSYGNAVTGWNWDFGDGSTSTNQNPSHTYTGAGTFSPSLLATNNNGLPLSGSGPSITVSPPDTDAFTANPISGSVPLIVSFVSAGVDYYGHVITNWNWTFGDGSTSTAQNPSHAYTNAGIFSPALIATNNLGGTVTGSGPASITVTNGPAYSGLVLNGGFETGDFTGWTVSGAVSNILDVFVDNGSQSGIKPLSGGYLAALGPVGSLSYLSQTVATSAGAAYLLSLWLDSPDGQTPNEFLVSWNGNTLFDETNIPAIGWTNLQFWVAATATNTVLSFGFRDDPGYLGLDDVSVAPASFGMGSVQVSGTNLVLAGTNGLAGGTYYVLTSTNLLLPLSQWTRVATNILSTSGNFTTTVTNTVTSGAGQRFYILQLQ